MADVDAARAVAGLKEIRAADRRRGRRPARRLDRHLDHRARLARGTSSTAIDGVTVERDEAGNTWATRPATRRALRDRRRAPRLGARTAAGSTARSTSSPASRCCARSRPRSAPLTLKLVDWADEEGARFGRSLLGSSACAGTLDPDAVRGLTDRDGTALPDALAAHDVDLDTMRESGAALEGALAYLELHIEQGPVLEQLDLPLGAVLGTFGVAAPQGRASPAPTPTPARARCTCAGRLPRRGAQRARVARRRRGARRRPRHDRRREGHAGDRDRVQRHLRGLARPARARRRTCSPTCSPTAKEASERIAAEEGCEVALGADLGDRADPVRRGADRPRRRRDRSEVAGTSARGCRRARCTTPPRWRASCRP